jgi:hypothetical protein
MARVFTDGGAMSLATVASNGKLFDGGVGAWAFWIYRTAAPAAERGLVGMGDFTTDVGWWINLTATGLINAIMPFATANRVRVSTTATALNGWTLVIVNSLGRGTASTNFTFYINGKLEAGTSTSNGAGAAPIDGSFPVKIGPGPGTSAAANTLAPPANMGPMAFWNRPLTDAEALALAGGAHPLRFKEGLVEVFDLDGNSWEEGYQLRLVLLPGATNPANTAVRPVTEFVPTRLAFAQRQDIRPRTLTRARYLVATSGLSATAAATLVLTSAAVATDPLSADTTATLVLTSAAVATDPLSAPASGTLVLTAASVATDPLSGTAAGTLVLSSTSVATDPLSATASGTLALTSTSAATDPLSAVAAGTLVLTSTADATVGGTSTATATATLVLQSTAAASASVDADSAATLVLTSASAVTDPLTATAAGTLALQSTAEAFADRLASASGLLVLQAAAVAVQAEAVPVDVGITGVMWGWWDNYQRRLERRRRARELPPITAQAVARLTLIGSATAVTGRTASAAGYLRLIGSATAHVDMTSFEEDELLLMAVLLEAMAA